MGRKVGKEEDVYSMAESDHWEPFHMHDQANIAMLNDAEYTAGYSPQRDTAHIHRRTVSSFYIFRVKPHRYLNFMKQILLNLPKDSKLSFIHSAEEKSRPAG